MRLTARTITRGPSETIDFLPITKKDDDEMPQLFDLSEVRASLDAFIESEKHKIDLPGHEGVLTRCQHAVLTPITIWRTAESNRGTDPALIMDAIISMCASTIAGEVTENVSDIDAQFSVVNKILNALAKSIAATIADGPVEVIKSVEAGNA